VDFVRARLGKFSDLAFRLKDQRGWRLAAKRGGWGFFIKNGGFNHEKLGPNHEK
jgi:hypothetical protein